MRSFGSIWVCVIGTTILVTAAAALAKKPQDGPPPQQVTDLLTCRGIADSQARLVCFDKATATISDAVAKHDLVVFDRESVRETKRGLFGLGIPNLGIFGDEDNEVEIKQIDGEIMSTSFNADGGYIFRLADGSRWTQLDSKPIAVTPRNGDKVVVKRGALGSYIMSVARQPGVKVRRTN